LYFTVLGQPLPLSAYAAVDDAKRRIGADAAKSVAIE
jgi:hypothetical protein